RGGDRLPGPGVDRQHHDEPDRTGDRGHRRHHGGVPDHQPVDFGVHELVQRTRGAQMSSLRQWLRENLFPGWVSGVFSALLIVILVKSLFAFVDWAFLEAIWRPDANGCRAAKGGLWGLIPEKHRFILFGTYPYEQHWRPGAGSVLLGALGAFSAIRAFWKWWLALVWFSGLSLIGMLMWGGVFGMPYVENERWGGLILTLLLSTFGVAFAFPLSILLALGRRSDMPVIRALCVGYIELIRGV